MTKFQCDTISAMNPPVTHPSHEPRLEGLRGIAIVTVILFHSALVTAPTFLEKSWRLVTLSGWAGVDLFFVLSGFLITRILLETQETENYFFNFYMRRILRIFPLYYLFLVVSIFFLHQSAPFDFTYWVFLSNILLGRLGHFQSEVLDVSWSLCVEEQFYIVWPVAVWFLGRKSLSRFCSILFFTALAFRFYLWGTGAAAIKNYVLLFCRMDSLCAGAWLACNYKEQAPEFFKKILWVAFPVGLCIFAIDVSPLSGWMRTLGFSVNALGGMALLGLTVLTPRSRSDGFLLHPILRSCGKYSFGMYLFHVPLIHGLSSWALPFWKDWHFSAHLLLLVQFAFHGLALLCSWCVAFFLYHAFEKHFLKMKKHFSSNGPSSSWRSPALEC